MSVATLIDMIGSWADVIERVGARMLVAGKVQKVFGGKWGRVEGALGLSGHGT